MPEIFSRFVYGLYGFVAVAILLVIFDKQLKDLEDRFDEWIARKKVKSNEQSDRGVCADNSAEQCTQTRKQETRCS